jgi:hypothetical protein
MISDLFDWTPPPGYPQSPGWTEPTTSRDAAAKIAPRAKTIRDQVLLAFQVAWPAGLTADDVAAKIGKSPFSVRPRCSELLALKEIMPTTRRRPNESGVDAIVWVCRQPTGTI